MAARASDGRGNTRAGGAEPIPPVAIDGGFFCDVLQDSLARGEAVRLRVRGTSMLPWLAENEAVRVVPVAGRFLRRGDIALFRRQPDRLILHRVVRVRRPKGSESPVYDCLGDANHGPPEKVPSTAVIGVVAMSGWARILFLAVGPVRRHVNRLCRKWGIRLRHD